MIKDYNNYQEARKTWYTKESQDIMKDIIHRRGSWKNLYYAYNSSILNQEGNII